MFGGNFAPVGWAFCQGQLLPISENETLFQLIGTTYGGDGQLTFALPNLQSRVPVHMGTGAGVSYVLGQAGGVETVTLTVNEIPAHSHAPAANTSGNSTSPAGAVWAGNSDVAQFAVPGSINGQMNAGAVQAAGGSQPHDNRIPFLAVNFIISLFGIFPSQS
jgi:microcystin-dependent protein